MGKPITEEEAHVKIHQIYGLLQELSEYVCPHCADEDRDPFFCETIAGRRFHARGGYCTASQFHAVGNLVDDLRDQFVNSEFNPERRQRMGDAYVFWVKRKGKESGNGL